MLVCERGVTLSSGMSASGQKLSFAAALANGG
jgi:hypothetical protein